jgi:ribokinase
MLVVVGSYNQDLVWRTPQFPKAGETRTGFFSQGPGGKGFNQAMAAHRLNCPTTFIAAIGDDALGANAQQLAASEKMQCYWQICNDSATGNAAIWLDDSGQNQILVDLAANRLLTAEHIDLHRAQFARARVVLVQQEANTHASRRALELAKENGAVCILNPAPALADTADMPHLADIITPNESEFSALLQSHGESISADEIALLSGQQLHALARKLNCPQLVITLGARGIVLSTETGFDEINPPTVKVRDTTGAGDCFNGALAAELANGANMLDACAFAVKASALKVEISGAALAMPSREQIQTRFGY